MKDNLILFPLTAELYQLELTRMLETERYGEAAQLLEFLLKCQSEDRQSREEWRALLEWLQAAFPIGKDDRPAGTGGEEEDEETDEQQLARQLMLEKSERDAGLVDHLLHLMKTADTPQERILAVEQLAHLDSSVIDGELKKWLETEPLPPLLQFKVLQMLGARQAEGSVTIERYGKPVHIELKYVPVSPEAFPDSFKAVLRLVTSVCDAKHPTLSFFAGQVWNDFLRSIYQTELYIRLLEADERELAIWASALHGYAMRLLFGGADSDQSSIFGLYGLPSSCIEEWERAGQAFENVFGTAHSPLEPYG